MSSSQLRIVIVGGGSNAWTPTIVKDMLLTEGLSAAQFVLLDIDPAAAELTKAFLEKLAGKLGVKAKFQATTNRPAALKGADYVVITISTGGLDAMAHDLAIPERFGIYHTVGDTTGPGGWARFIRNFDVFAALARDFNRHCPRAAVLNYTNPMTTLTTVLARLCKAPVVGLCHGLFENIHTIAGLYGVKSDEVAIRYAGLNHFFWITQAKAGGKDVLADLNARLKKRSLDDILRAASPDPMGYKSGRAVATELFRLTGVMPYLGDRHTSECFPWYITSKENLRKYKLVRTTIQNRRKGFQARRAKLKEMISGEIPERFFKPSRETAADIIAALSGGRVFIDVGNVPNIGQVSNLPAGTVVETAVRVDGTGFSPIAHGPLPEMVRVLVEPWCHVFNTQVEACFRRDLRLALQALRMDPLCSHLNTEKVHALGGRLLKAHKKFITAF